MPQHAHPPAARTGRQRPAAAVPLVVHMPAAPTPSVPPGNAAHRPTPPGSCLLTPVMLVKDGVPPLVIPQPPHHRLLPQPPIHGSYLLPQQRDVVHPALQVSERGGVGGREGRHTAGRACWRHGSSAPPAGQAPLNTLPAKPTPSATSHHPVPPTKKPPLQQN